MLVALVAACGRLVGAEDDPATPVVAADASTEASADGNAPEGGAGVSCGGTQCVAPAQCCSVGAGLACMAGGCGTFPVVACDDPGDCVKTGGSCCLDVNDGGAAMIATHCGAICSVFVCAAPFDCPGNTQCLPLNALGASLSYCGN